MREYLLFAIIPIFLLTAYFSAPLFINNQSGKIPVINAINLPNFEKSKSYKQATINSFAFVHKQSNELKSYETAIKIKPLHLSMIYFDKNNKFCRINGTIFREGDRYKNIKVIRIRQDQVLIRDGKKLIKLRLKVRANENG